MKVGSLVWIKGQNFPTIAGKITGEKNDTWIVLRDDSVGWEWPLDMYFSKSDLKRTNEKG
jgi:hypothetical protein